MKKKILELLKTKFEGVSESILDRIAEKLAKTVTTEEQAATSVEGVTLQQVLEAYGDSRATEATKTAVSNYEKRHGLKDGRKIGTDDHDGDGDSAVSSVTKLINLKAIHNCKTAGTSGMPAVSSVAKLINLKAIHNEMRKINHDTLIKDLDSCINKDTPFYDKKIVITGVFSRYPKREDLARMLKDYGADIDKSISKRTDMVIMGAGAGPKKMEKIRQLNDAGCDIRSISETELYQILDKLPQSN